ncbi:MAG: response regulator [Lentisphaerae bacterium]|nr:response regulator [Lentisphaerota bacterium]
MPWRVADGRVRVVARKRVATVLIVVDDVDLQKYVVLVLGQEYPVLSCSSGEDALRIAKNARPDVIILDALIPGELDGFTVFCDLRKSPETARIKVLMLTEVNRVARLRFDADNMGRHLGEAPQAFMEKPISPGRLRQAVATILSMAVETCGSRHQ